MYNTKPTPCYVCGYMFDYDPQVDSDGADVCVCCGFQFTIDDMNVPPQERTIFYAGCRMGWVNSGCKWWGERLKDKPANWDIREQLSRVMDDYDQKPL